MDCGETFYLCVYRATKSQRTHSQRVGSPWTAMVFLSCRIVFPADTCTVTVLVPSWENVHATLPSRVISGCWGRRKDSYIGGRGEGHGKSQSLGTLMNDWSHTVIYTTEVSNGALSQIHTHSHIHAHTCMSILWDMQQSVLCCMQRWGLQRVPVWHQQHLPFITHILICSSHNYKMLIVPPFITNWHNWLSSWKAPVGAEQTHLHNYVQLWRQMVWAEHPYMVKSVSAGPERWRADFIKCFKIISRSLLAVK